MGNERRRQPGSGLDVRLKSRSMTIDHQDRTARRGGLVISDIARDDVPQAFQEMEGKGNQLTAYVKNR